MACLNPRYSLGQCTSMIIVILKAIQLSSLHLKVKLSGVDTTKLVFGTDDEKAMVNAITSSFPNSQHILCTRHLRQNVNQKLTDAAVDKSDRNLLLNKIFGDEGIINADDTVRFEEKCEEVETLSQSISQSFLRYFQKRVRDNLA